MDLYEKIPIIPELFFITSHRNSGAARGILEDQFIFFYIVTFIVVAGIIYYMQKYAKNFPLLAIALGRLLGGAIGNFIHRLIRSVVVDGLNYYMSKYGTNFPLFACALRLLLGGAIVHFIARLIRKEVVDFLAVMIIRYDFPIFNIADSALTIGVVLVIIPTIIDDR